MWLSLRKKEISRGKKDALIRYMSLDRGKMSKLMNAVIDMKRGGVKQERQRCHFREWDK